MHISYTCETCTVYGWMREYALRMDARVYTTCPITSYRMIHHCHYHVCYYYDQLSMDDARVCYANGQYYVNGSRRWT